MSNKTPEIMHVVKSLAPYPAAWDKDAEVCATCGKADRLVFRDELSKREYLISRMCQRCQDEVFGA